MNSRIVVKKASLSLLVILAFVLSGCEIVEDIAGGNASSPARPRPTPRPTSRPPPSPVGYNATLEITGLICHNGEEDDYAVSSGEDEITFIYTLIETDRYGKAVRSSTYGWGPYDVRAGDGYDTRFFEDISLSRLPVGHGLVVTLSIVEIEDYSKAQQVLGTINKYARYVEMANTFNPEPYSRTAIEIVGDILYYSKIGLDFVAWADDDDVLADQVDVGTPDFIQSALLGSRQLGNGWVFSGSNNTDNYEYEVSYVVHLQPIYP